MMGGTRLAAYALAWLAAMFGIGIAEETTFRAAGLITLAEAIGFWPAAIALSAIFGAIHYFGKGPVENIADALSVSLIGLFMSLTVWRTGSIWFAVGFHALFDYAALKSVAEKLGIERIDRRQGALQVKFHQQTHVDPARLLDLVRRTRGAQFTPAGVLQVPFDGLSAPAAVLGFVRERLAELHA